MVEKRQQLLRERQGETYREMCECLKKNGMCCVVRPTGFGKTKLFMDYVADHRDGAHLYIYDTNSAKSDINASSKIIVCHGELQIYLITDSRDFFRESAE